MREPLGLILAGGLARRMGGTPKHGLDLGGMSLMDHCTARLDPQVSAIAISANTPINTSHPVLKDTKSGYLGPLAGILAGLDWAHHQGGTHLVSVAVDTPFFPCDLVPRLILAGMDHPQGFAIATTAQGVHATFGLWPVSLRAPLLDFLNDGGRKLRIFTNDYSAAKAQFDDERSFFNINTPENLQQAASWM